MKGYSTTGRTAGAKLTAAEVQHIRRQAAAGVRMREIADAYELSLETVRRIVRWETWRWVGEEELAPEPKFTPLPEPSEAEITASMARLQELMKPDGGAK